MSSKVKLPKKKLTSEDIQVNKFEQLQRLIVTQGKSALKTFLRDIVKLENIPFFQKYQKFLPKSKPKPNKIYKKPFDPFAYAKGLVRAGKQGYRIKSGITKTTRRQYPIKPQKSTKKVRQHKKKASNKKYDSVYHNGSTTLING